MLFLYNTSMYSYGMIGLGGVGVGVYLGSIGGVGAKESLLEFHLCHHPIIFIVF